MTVDPRLRAAIDANTCWYDALCAVHGVRCAIRDGLWLALDPPPPLHSTVKTVEPWVDAAGAMAAWQQVGEVGSISDVFGSLDLPGMATFIEASWLFHPGVQPGSADRRATGDAARWVTVTEPDALAAWTSEHDTSEVLLPGLLDRSSFLVLAEYDSARPVGSPVPVAGAVLHLTGGVLSLSNVWAATGHELDWSELVALAGDRFPGRPVTGYEWGEDLDSAKAAGFVEVGVHKVWGAS